MNFFEKILYAMSFTMNRPTFLSVFHIVSLILTIVATVGLAMWFYLKKPSEKTVRIVILIGWLIMLVLEGYKQLAFSFSYSEAEGVTWKYHWNSFPFQLCSSALYVLPFIALWKDNKIRDAFLAYLCTFSFFGGFIVIIYPDSVFTVRTLINAQSMIHHAIQVILGVALAVHYRKKFTWKFFATGLIVYTALLAVAMLLNATIPLAIGDAESFNMFYISWKYPCILPVLSIVYTSTPYVVFLLCYILGFLAVSSLVFAVIKLTIYISAKCRKKKEAKNA